LSALVARRLTQRFGSDLALDAVDLMLESGEHLAVLGENGSGKTTLLRILATAARPTSGSLEIFGLDARSERKGLRARIGFVAHAPGLYPALSCAENLEFFCSLQGIDRSRVPETLALVGLNGVARRLAGRLSRGEQQRLAIGRAVLHDPELVVLDEPDASLDSGGADLLAKVMHSRSAVLATHDKALANRLCTRNIVLRSGRVLGAETRLQVAR
jgi:heme ABC exporter ATP-binding subunit CcmA